MSGAADLERKAAARNAAPVTNPVRVFLIDPDIAAATVLSRAIDLDRELAVVGLCRDPRRAGREADHCRPDLVAIRLGLDDQRCVQVLSDLAESNIKACVVVLGAAVGDNPHSEASALKGRIRLVAEENFGLAPEARRPVLPAGGRRLH